MKKSIFNAVCKTRYLALLVVLIFTCGNVWGVTYTKITSTTGLPADGSSAKYLIVYESLNYVYDGSKTGNNLGASGDYKTSGNTTFTRSGSTITIKGTDNFYFTISRSGNNYIIQSASGYYIGRTANSNGLDQSTSSTYNHTITFSGNNAQITSSGGPKLQFLNSSGSSTFKYYKSSQQLVQLYKLDASCEDLSTPGSLSSATVTSNSVSPSWGSVSHASKYEVVLMNSSGTALTPTSTYTIETTSTSYTFSGLEASTPYKWKVKAVGDGTDYCDSEYTSNQTITTSASTTPTLTLTGSGAFGTVNVDGTKDLNFTLNGSNLSANASVSVTGSGFTLVTPAGGTLTQTAGSISGSNNITVRFSPTAATSYAGTLTVTSTGASDATVSLSGTGQLSDTYVDLMHDNSDITKTGSYSAPSMSTDDTGSDCKGTHTYFAGWSTSAGSTTVSVKAGDAVTADGSTYYAVWGDGVPGWQAVTQLSELTTGKTFLIVSASSTYYLMSSTISSNRFANASAGTVSITDGVLTTTSDIPDAAKWSIYKSGDYYYIKQGTNYAAGTSTKNQGAMISDNTNNLAKWNVTVSDGVFDFENYGRSLLSTDAANRYLRSNTTSGFACYLTGTGQKTRIFVQGGGSIDYKVSCCADAAEVTLTPSSQTVYRDIDGNAAATIAFSKTGGGSGTWGTPTVDPSGPTVTKDGSNINFSATATGTYTVGIGFTETCEKTGSATVTVAEQPIITASGTTTFSTTCGTNSASSDITVNSRYLSGSTITASISTETGSGSFKISTDNSTFATTSKSITGGTSSKATSHIYVRYEPTADESGSIAGTLTLTCGGKTETVSLSGTVTCGCNIRFTSAANLVQITAANDIWVQANSELALSGSFLKTNADNANVSIRAYTNNAHFQLKTSGTTGEGAAKTSSANALTLATNESSNTANGWTGSIGIVYKPAAHNTTESATLTVEVYRYNGSTVYASTTYTLYGRSLPENFVIAVTDGSSHWFAVPADMVAPWGGSCSTGLGTYAPYPIEVDNTTTPTALSSNPPSRAVYTAAARTGNTNTNPQTLSFKSVTLAGSGNYYLYGSISAEGSATHIQDASNNESEKQKWFLDVIDWSTKKYNMHLSSDLNTNLLSYYSGNVGQYNAAGKKPDIFILPVTATCDYYLAPTNITCQGIDNTYYYFRFKPDRTSNYEVSLNGSLWSDLTTTIVNECTDEDHPTLLEGKVALATYRGQTVYIRVKSAGGCQSNTTFSVPNPSVEVNAGTWMNMTGMAGYAFANSANSVTISDLASCGDQVVGVTCDNNKISASVNQSTGVVTISMTAGDATAGVHTGTLEFTLTGGTTRTQNIQITLQSKAVQEWDGGDAVFFPGDDDNTRMLCYNSGKIAEAAYPSATEPTVCLSYALYYNGLILTNTGTLNTYSNLYLMDMSTGTEVTAHSMTRSVTSGVVKVLFTNLLANDDLKVGHRYRLIWENHSSNNTYEDQFTNSAGVPFQDCHMDFVYTTNCEAPSLLPACATATTVDLYWRDTEDGCSSTQTVEVYTKSSSTAASKNLTNQALSAWNYVTNVTTNKQSWMWDDKNTGYTLPSLSDAGYVITDVKNDKYGVVYSPLFNTISDFDATEQFTIEITLKANSASDANVGVQLWLVADNSSNAGNHTWTDTNNSSADFNQTGNSTVKILNIPTTAKTYSFDITGAVATNRIKIKGYEGASIASSTKNVYIRSIAIKKNSRSTVKSTTVSSGTTHVSFSGLTANTDYYAVVKCGNEESNEVSFKTMSGAAASVNFYSDAEFVNVITEAEIVAGTPKTVYVRGTNVALCEDEASVTINSCFNIDNKNLTYNGSTHVLEGNITISNVCAAADGDLVVDVNGEHVLPLHCGDRQIELVQWAPHGVLVESYVLPAATPQMGSIVGVLNNGAYTIQNNNLDLTVHANELLKITWGSHIENFRVPIMITGSCNSSTLSTVIENSIIVVMAGQTLTINNALTCEGIEIYPTAKLQFSSGSLTAKYIRLYNNGDTWANFAKLDVSGASSITVDNVYADFRIDEDRFHYITLPFDIPTGDVTYAAPTANGAYAPALRDASHTTAFYVRQYDGRARETNNLATENTYNVNMPHIGAKGGSYTMTAGRGYMIGIGDQMSATGHKKRTLRFPIAMNSTKWTAEKASSKIVGGSWVADGTDNASARATNKGWNLVGNPFMRELTVTSTSGGLATGYLDETGGNPIWEINDDGIRYITIYNAATDAFTYQPLNTSFTLKPMAAFYVQMKNAKYIHFQEALDGQASIPAILRAPLEEKEEEVNVIISLSNENQSDKAGIVLHSKYDAAYNEADDADYPKLMSNTQLALWSIVGEERLASNGLPKTAIENIPLGYQAPTTGHYSFTLNMEESNTKLLKHVWLTDLETATVRDLLLEDYTFNHTQSEQSTTRFLLGIELFTSEELTTSVDEFGDSNVDVKPIKFIYKGMMYIQSHGVIYDATGKRVREIR